MKTFTLVWVIASTLIPAICRGEINASKQLDINFTDKSDAAAKATWATFPSSAEFRITREGLGFEGDEKSSLDGWIQTKPIALGLSWRPTENMFVRARVQPPATETSLPNNGKMFRDVGQLYVRYSPDLAHWSSWQLLPRIEPQYPEEKKTPGSYFSSEVRVPYSVMSEYRRLLREYSQKDVPWKSDEEAAVKWMLEKDPTFFEKQIPFIGYAQFLYENNFCGGHRLQSIHVDISYQMGGMFLPPQDESVEKGRNRIPWRFEAKKE
jgi:hypothetical protein